ncbi:MAG: ABC transporter ATP-binding protein [Bacilli bacterium]
MIKILKKFSIAIIFAVSLIVVQANCELALPDYTSRIVNVGIQQGGIESPSFTSVSKKTLDKVKSLTVKSDDLIIDSAYKFDESKNYYVINKLDEEETKKLNETLLVPEAIIAYLESGVIDVSSLGFNSNEDMYQAFNNMNDTDLSKFVSNIKSKLSSEETFLNQISVNFVKSEYKSLGLDTNKIQLNYIVNAGLKMLGIALIAAVVTVITAFLSSKIAAYFAHDLRSAIAKKVMTFSNKEFEEISTASLITRSTNDVTQIQNLITMAIRILCFAPIMGFGAILKVRGSSLSWIIVTTVLVIITLIVVIFMFVTPKFKIVQKAIDKLNLISREFVSGIPVIRAFSNEKYQEKKFDKANKDLNDISLFLDKVTSVLNPIMMFVMNLTCIMIVWFGAKQIDLGTMQVGTLMAFINYTMHIIMSFLMISMFSIMLPRAVVSIKRVNEILNKDSSIRNKKITKEIDETKKGSIEFKEVYFRYADAPEDVLENISFKVKPGSTTAFIGSTGSGKSTLINLIPRFFDVTDGEVLVDGVDIKDIKVEDLRKRIGFVPQKGMLFSGTIKSNIALGVDNLTDEEIDFATKISCSDEFINNKEDGLNSEISEGGTNVSGGQRQRLAIARAIAKKPEILIFDDSFSALDYKTDSKVRKLINKNLKDTTILIVAQRISTIMNADQIIVLDEGQIVNIGTHEELVKNCSVYKEIVSSQLKEV